VFVISRGVYAVIVYIVYCVYSVASRKMAYIYMYIKRGMAKAARWRENHRKRGAYGGIAYISSGGNDEVTI